MNASKNAGERRIEITIAGTHAHSGKSLVGMIIRNALRAAGFSKVFVFTGGELPFASDEPLSAALLTTPLDAIVIKDLKQPAIKSPGQGMERVKAAFIAKVVKMYEQGLDNAYEAFKNRAEMFSQALAPNVSEYTKQETEGDLTYVTRCLELDFDMGFGGDAVYQEVWNEVVISHALKFPKLVDGRQATELSPIAAGRLFTSPNRVSMSHPHAPAKVVSDTHQFKGRCAGCRHDGDICKPYERGLLCHEHNLYLRPDTDSPQETKGKTVIPSTLDATFRQGQGSPMGSLDGKSFDAPVFGKKVTLLNSVRFLAPETRSLLTEMCKPGYEPTPFDAGFLGEALESMFGDKALNGILAGLAFAGDNEHKSSLPTSSSEPAPKQSQKDQIGLGPLPSRGEHAQPEPQLAAVSHKDKGTQPAEITKKIIIRSPKEGGGETFYGPYNLNEFLAKTQKMIDDHREHRKAMTEIIAKRHEARHIEFVKALVDGYIETIWQCRRGRRYVGLSNAEQVQRAKEAAFEQAKTHAASDKVLTLPTDVEKVFECVWQSITTATKSNDIIVDHLVSLYTEKGGYPCA